MANRKRAGFETWLMHVFLGVNAVIMLYPIIMMALSGFKTNAEIFSHPFAMPKTFNLDNFRVIWTQTDVPRYLLNSTIVTGLSVFILTGSCARCRPSWRTAPAWMAPASCGSWCRSWCR